MTMSRREFVVGSATFAVASAFAANGRQLKPPLMLDTKRMAIHDGPSCRRTALRGSRGRRSRGGS